MEGGEGGGREGGREAGSEGGRKREVEVKKSSYCTCHEASRPTNSHMHV